MTLADVLARLTSVRPRADYYMARCPAHRDRTPSLSIHEAEDGRILFHCFAGCDYRVIVGALGLNSDRERRPLPPLSLGRENGTDREQRIEAARRLWREGKPAAGTHVDRYLKLRGITIPPPPSIRFAIGRHAPRHTGPWGIMIAAVQKAGGEILGVHRTFLTGDGRKAPVEPVKMALGPIGGGAVRLAPAAETLALAEGVETALSVLQATGIPTWATLGAANLPHVELPGWVREVLIAADSDDNGAGERAAAEAARRLVAQGRRVRIMRPEPGRDFNDYLSA